MDALRSLTTAVNETHYATGEIELLDKATSAQGDVSVRESVRLPIRYQDSPRTRFDPQTGQQVQEPRFLVLQEPLAAAMRERGVTTTIMPSANLDAFLYDADGSKYDAGLTSADPNRIYWSIDVRRVAGPPVPDVLALARRIIVAGVPLLSSKGSPITTKGNG